MPRRNDLKRIMILGSGPIVIGQAAEFDYSGAQACKILREEGYEVVLVNSNPATIMTDPEFADATYVEPLIPSVVAQIIEKERPDALLPTLGGQTALNLAKSLQEDGTLEKYDVELIGANYDAIHRAEDRDAFAHTMAEAGLKMPISTIVTDWAKQARYEAASEKVRESRSDTASSDEALAASEAERTASVEEHESVEEQIAAAIGVTGLPAIIRPAFTLGGRGGGIAYTEADFDRIARQGLDASPIGQILIDQSVIGWGEFELEVMRDRADNVVIVCSIENIDPMGVHTGDSVTVAPQQTLTDRLYQKLRDQAIAVIRAVGVETGGSNVQFAVNPETEEILVIEMNPRVSRSSALASKATGFPIAKIAARLAVGYLLEEIDNDITGATPAAFEPTIDYVVVKWPRFAFEKFQGADPTLTTHMKSVGEAMAMGRNFKQAFAKAMRSRELDKAPEIAGTLDELLELLRTPNAERYDVLFQAVREGATVEQLNEATKIDLWYLRELHALALDPSTGAHGKRVYRSVDTCAAEFPARTPYFYSAWEHGNPVSEVERGDNASVIILGSGPNRIGQGIEFDYCCVHAAWTVKASGRDAVMVNCNPETVSTDYDTSTRLYFEPLTLEDVLAIVEIEQPEGVIVQFGGQTPLKLAAGLQAAGVPILGTSVDSIDLAEDRGRFGALLDRLELKAPPYTTATSGSHALEVADEVGFPLLARPSYVLGGRAMEIVYSKEGLGDYLERTGGLGPREIFLDRFLEQATEVDVDALCDGEEVWVGGIMEHVEQAGIHSGDSACVLPPHTLSPEIVAEITRQAQLMALELGVIGLVNFQFAVSGDDVYVIEANPRASRTVPFVSKAIGQPLASLAVKLMLGEKIASLGLPEDPTSHGYVAVKEAVLPFDRFAGADAVLGPEMRSTGEVMGVARDVATAFAKAQAGAGSALPDRGTVFITVTDIDKPAAVRIGQQLTALGGFDLVATSGTAAALREAGITVKTELKKVGEGSPNVVDLIENGDVDLVVNTPTGSGAHTDGWQIRRAAIANRVACITTATGAEAAVRAIERSRDGDAPVISLQELHAAAAAR
ncbi:MAG: carbamoyl-phosphate synthase large subunit [Solirubrobacteraceae bacterium]|nr:carbamoyl-phosphate synthase large subunit [Solirubrobacteraceae bacterium]